MRVLFGIALAAVAFTSAQAGQVRGYTRSDGTYVAPYTRSSPSSSGSSSYGIYSAPSSESHAIQGHVTSNGTYVAPSRATNPNNSLLDNYSTKPNVNPYTGQVGTKKANPYGF